MADIRPLSDNFLSTDELRKLGLPQSFIDDYVNVSRNFAILGSQFQALKNGNQTTTGTFAPLTAWTQEVNQTGYNFDAALGELTFSVTSVYTVDVSVFSDGTTGIEIKLEKYDGSTWNDVSGSLMGNPSGAVIPSILIQGSLSQKIRVSVRDTGGAVDITDARITVGRKA